MSGPYGQPEPFDPMTMAPPVARRPAPSTMRRLLPFAGALVIAVAAFGGGYAVANATAPKTTANGGTGFNGTTGGGGPFASGRPRGGGFGGGATGTIGSVTATEMTITTAAGAQRIVLLTPSTTVTQVSTETKTVTDLANGQTVTVVGQANPDGSVTATNVIIGNIGALGRGGFGGFGADRSPAPSSTP